MEQKQCTRCGEMKDITEFWPKYGKARTISSWCKRCHSVDGVAREQRRKAESEEFRAQRRESARALRFRKKFGITRADYDQMLAAQGGVCAICGSDERSINQGVERMLAVDHDHNTGKVRGILCERCNRAIGLLKDSPAILRRAANYIEQHAEQTDV
jgi:hypothetical protein